ncbi:uncharacterized protein PADG_06707 [Paracoccidioides brasiliensis Pb18]|uniref:Uncharacterized protein n=1 Tax=Paracoccidioides brasiliensis (strain Pb18) TaxID=502780 RepID=C1GHH1_PARBD|nr:uncharacterized protein PADG_06707 [Paracoccidioides brasiliensis Pb18]EEH50628.2 hypothetical protein PADG_06707 [Paracoccidioides brasiliensis Pb18]
MTTPPPSTPNPSEGEYKNHRCIICDDLVPEFPCFEGPNNPSFGPMVKHRHCTRGELPLAFPQHISMLNEIGFTDDVVEFGGLKFPSYFHGDCFKALAADKTTDASINKKVAYLCEALVPLFKLPRGNPTVMDDFILQNALTKLAKKHGWDRLTAGEEMAKKFDENESFAEMMYKMWLKVPVEIKLDVWKHLDICLAKSLLSVTAETADLLGRVKFPVGECTGRINLRGQIRAYLITIRGFQYICGIHDGKRLLGHESDKVEMIDIPTGVIAVKYVIGPYGLSSLGIFGDNRMAWIGDYNTSQNNKGKWAGLFRTKTVMKELSFEWDALKIISVSNPADKIHKPECQLIWDEAVPLVAMTPFPNLTMYKRQECRDYWSSFPRNKRLSLAKALPLYEREFSLYGVTAFCHRSGALIGLRSDFRSSKNSEILRNYQIGDQDGIPIHFRLRSSEAVVWVWGYEAGHSHVQMPGMVIGTNRGRAGVFGPVLPAGQEGWTMVTHLNRGIVLALFVTQTKLIKGTQITEFGTLCSEIPAPAEMHIPNIVNNNLAAPPRNMRRQPIFVTHACLRNISKIVACYREDRCSGLLLEHTDSDVCDVVGRWYENDKDKHVTLFSLQGSAVPPAKLRFHLSSGVGVRTVDSIEVRIGEQGNSDGSGDNDIVDIEDEWHFAWWFMDDEDIVRRVHLPH